MINAFDPTECMESALPDLQNEYPNNEIYSVNFGGEWVLYSCHRVVSREDTPENLYMSAYQSPVMDTLERQAEVMGAVGKDTGFISKEDCTELIEKGQKHFHTIKALSPKSITPSLTRFYKLKYKM